MKKLWLLFLIAGVIWALSGLAQAGTASIVAGQGKAIEFKANSGAWVPEYRLKTRSAGTWSEDPAQNTLDANKSYLQFDLTQLYADNPGLQGNVTGATLTIYAISDGKSYNVSGLNDGVGEAWDAGTIDWFSAPGNDTTSGSGLDGARTAALYSVNPTVADGPAAGDVTAFVNADTDGLVTFILTAGGTAYMYNILEGSSYNVDFVPVLTVEGNIVSGGEGCYEVGTPYTFTAVQSCRTDIQNPTANQTDSSKLSVRTSPADSKSAKSWIKFDLGGLDPNNLKAATLTVALHASKGGAQNFDISLVNDDYRNNIGWTEGTLTWNNAPGNDLDDLGLLEPAQTTLMKTVIFENGAAGQQFTIDVRSAIEADTDGILQFVLHNSPNLLEFSTHDHAVEANRPVLYLLEGPEGADLPSLCPGEIVSSDLDQLSWTNPDPNDGVSDITCTVYFGTDPNRPDMDSVTLPANAHSVLINTDNFPTYGTLENLTTYYWAVDCYDPARGMIPGMMWSFRVNDNEAPLVDAGPDQMLWGAPLVVNLDGTTSDDGRPAAYTVLWSQEDNGAPAVDISATSDDTSVTISEPGDYVFVLTADDGEYPVSDTVRIVVGEDACDASHIYTGDPYAAGDANRDCLVNLEDFALLMAANWMDCTDTLTGCGL